jgi:hypothetical protein
LGSFSSLALAGKLGGETPAQEPHRSEQRSSVRSPLKSAAFPIRTATATYQIRFKDISTGGACGLICEPVQVGDFVIVEFDRAHQIEAQICWVRRLMVGLKFTHPLAEDFIARLSENLPAKGWEWALPGGEAAEIQLGLRDGRKAAAVERGRAKSA